MLEQEERTRRIVATAVELAEEGGFEAVRMRDVAAHAGVALGTFYKRFRSKEDLLVAALELESEQLGKRLSKKMNGEGTRQERVLGFFDSIFKEDPIRLCTMRMECARFFPISSCKASVNLNYLTKRI